MTISRNLSAQIKNRHLTGWAALCSLLSGREQGSVKPTAGSRVTVSRDKEKSCEISSIFHKNTRIACIYWPFRRWKRQFSLPHIFHQIYFRTNWKYKARFSANKAALLTNKLTFPDLGWLSRDNPSPLTQIFGKSFAERDWEAVRG